MKSKRSALHRTSKARRKSVRVDPKLVDQAELHIECAEHDTASLAGALGTSIPTASRMIAALRRKLAEDGIEMVAVRRGPNWHYEIRNEDQVRKAMAELTAMAGFIEDGPILRPGETVDDVLYPKRGKMP